MAGEERRKRRSIGWKNARKEERRWRKRRRKREVGLGLLEEWKEEGKNMEDEKDDDWLEE